MKIFQLQGIYLVLNSLVKLSSSDLPLDKVVGVLVTYIVQQPQNLNYDRPMLTFNNFCCYRLENPFHY